MTFADTARVVVLTRHGCHLCDDAQNIIETVCQDLNVSWQAVDVDADPELRSHFNDHVPVTFVDGEQFSIWFLDPEKFRARLGG